MNSKTSQEDDLDKAVPILRALANPTRLRIALEVASGECSVAYLEEKLDLPQPGLSQHLAILRKAGYLTTRRKSRHIYYLVNQNEKDNVLRKLLVLLFPDSSEHTSPIHNPTVHEAYASRFAMLVTQSDREK